jgi:hypothetical protein
MMLCICVLVEKGIKVLNEIKQVINLIRIKANTVLVFLKNTIIDDKVGFNELNLLL